MSSIYKNIAEEISNEILNGKYNDTMKLPKEEELVTQYGVSRTTIRKSLSILVNKGYVYQVQGSGIFVRDSITKDCINLEKMKGLTQDCQKKKISAQPIELKIIEANEELSKKMKCDIGTKVYFVKRLRFVNDERFTVEYSYFRKDIVPYLSYEIAEKSIYSYLTDDLGLSIGFADRIIYCDKLKEQDARLLGLEKDDPGLFTENTVFLSNGIVFEVSTAVHNYKNTKFIKLANF